MRRFLYYFPKLPGINPQMLANRGLLDRFTGVGGELLEHVIVGMVEGPEATGCLLSTGSQPPTYDRVKQAWMQVDGHWVGIEDAPPRPSDLARPVGISGHETLLSDGCVWRVPLIRQWDIERHEHVSNLPKVMTPKDGRVVMSIRQDYVAVDAIAERVWSAFVSQATVSLDDLMRDATAIMAVNYRIGVVEAGLLGLFDEATAFRVLSLAIDLPTLESQAQSLSVQGLEYVAPEVE